MNKDFAIVLSCAVTVLGLASCGNKETDLLKPESKTHTVVFDAQAPAATETKTALHLQVIPDWRNTDVNDVHIFEKETTTSGSYMMEASRVLMETNDDYTKARFYAEFDNASVIVNPPVMETKASSSQFNYTAIMATREGDKYMVPSVQYPHEQSLIDPKADFLVGGSDETYNETLHEQTFLLDFLRPVALARLAITNLEGTKVNEVKITTANYITGFATYDDVDFENKTVEFQGDESNKVLTLLYPEGKKKTTTFYAYFVCMPGEIQFSEIKVYTDQYVFTKTYASPASLTLKGGDFMNIALDMTPKDGNGVTKTGLDPQTLSFVANDDTVTEIEFDIYEHELGEFVAPTLVIGEDVVDPTKVEVTSSNEEVAVVEVVEGEFVVTLAGGTGEATITATVPGDDTHTAGSASYKIIVTDSTPAPANPKFYKADELVDGQEYIIVSNGMAMTLVEETTTGTKANVTLTLDAVEVNAVDGVIETDENVAVWTASTQVEYYTNNNQSYEAGHFALKCGDVYLQRLSNQSEQTLIVGDIPSTGKYYVWDYDGEYLSHLSSSTTTFYVGYNDGWGVVYNGTLPKVTLYTTTKPLTKQTISFGEQPVTAKYDLNTTEWTVAVPELIGAQTTVTYSSDNDAIEVDASTGAINITDDAKKGDKATITATAAQTEEYASAKATYTIEIIDSSEPQPTGTTYYLTAKPEDVVSGDYLVVSYDYDRIFDGSGDNKGGYTLVTADGISADKTAGTITVSNDAKASLEFAITRTDNTLTLKNALGTLALGTNTDSYITFNETGTTFTLDPTLTSETNKAIYFYTVKNNVNQYLYYKDSGSGTLNVFKIGQSGNDTSNGGIHLYFAGERAAQNIAFSKTEDSYDKASEDPYVAPTLDGAKTAVSYASSNTNVATVDAEGVVTIVSTGETTITATAAASTEYLSATASYTLTVENTNEVVSVFNKVTSNDEVEDDAKYILVYETSSKAFKPILAEDGKSFTKGTANAIGVTIVNNTISSSDLDDCLITFEDGKYLWIESASKYLYSGDSGDNALGAEDKTTSHTVSITVDNNGIATVGHSDDTKYHLYWSSSNYFSGINQNNNATSGPSYNANICIYKLDDGRQPQTLSFSASSAKYDKGTSTWTVDVPTLSGAQTNVTYSSSNESIATVTKVDNTTVTVTIASGAKKNDTAVITAIAEADATFKQGKASFTVVVDDSKSVTPEYTLVESSDDIEDGGVYLLVNETNNKVFKPVLESSTSTNFTSAAANAVSATITNHTITSDDFEECELTLEDGYYFHVEAVSRYLYPTSSNIGAEETKSSSHSFNISIGSAGVADISRTSNGQTYRLRWTSSGSGYFQSSTSSANCQLYKRQTSGPKKRNLAFSASEVSVNIYGQSLPYAFAGAPTLSGRTDGVTYNVTCSNTEIAQSAYPTVSSTGAVTINGTGVFTIKASAAATTELQAGEASYTLTVTSVAPSTYTLIEGYANLATGTYLIVEKTDTYLFNATNVTTTINYQTTTVNNCGYADLNNTTGISKSGNTITLSSDIAKDYEFVFTRTDDNLTIKQVGGTHEGQYMFASSSVSNSFIGFQASAATFVLNKQTNTNLIYFSTTKSSTNPTEYLYKKSSDSFFKLGGSGAPGESNAGVYLYKKN